MIVKIAATVKMNKVIVKIVVMLKNAIKAKIAAKVKGSRRADSSRSRRNKIVASAPRQMRVQKTTVQSSKSKQIHVMKFYGRISNVLQTALLLLPQR